MSLRVPMSAIPPGEVKQVVVDGDVVAVANVDGTFHAVEGCCPHASGPLGDGILRGGTLTCPWHGWRFDVASGTCLDDPGACLETYSVQVDGDDRVIARG